MSYTNADGLRVLTNGEAGVAAQNGLNAASAKKTMTAVIDLTKGNQDLTNGEDSAIPAGSYITAASMVVTTAAAGGTNVTVGLKTGAGGIDATVLTAALAANKAVACDGALVGGTDTVGADDAYLSITTSGTFSAGVFTLVIEYIEA